MTWTLRVKWKLVLNDVCLQVVPVTPFIQVSRTIVKRVYVGYEGGRKGRRWMEGAGVIDGPLK